MKALHLPLKEKWYRMIESGEKREEYREITPYWMKRLCWDDDYNEPMSKEDIEALCQHPKVENMFDAGWKPKPFTHVHFTLGYPKKDDAERNMVFAIERITVGKGQPKWGAEKDKEYFVIKLGERL